MATQASSESTPPQRPKVIFVMGAGHSGSTILGVTLGNCEGVLYAGELDNWLVRSGVSVLGGTKRTRFWDSVRADVPGAQELFGYDCELHLERSSAALRLGAGETRRRLRGRYRQVTTDLYRALARVSGATHVVDTAHFPLRARELQQLEGIELHIVFLLRDPEAVVASYIRFVNRNERAQRLFRTLQTNAEMWLTYLLCVRVFLRQPRRRRMLLRHEDFLANPAGVLRDILDRVGSDAPIPDLGALGTGVPIQANRLIRSEVVALKIGRSEHHPSSRLTAWLQRPWAPIFAKLGPRVAAKAAHEPATAAQPR
jgi:sulfotransferase family protein